jgi:hypothetical protein
MAEQPRITVTLHWRDDGGVQTRQMTCADRSPHDLIPMLVEKTGLPAEDDASHTVFYRLRLDGEQGPALRSRETLSRQHVADGSRLWLVPELLTQEGRPTRCLLRLPDGSEIVLPARGQGLQRTWLMSFLHLHNPEAYAREIERFERYQSPYRYVSDKRPHCHIRLSDRGTWVVSTDRADTMTECATGDDFEPVPVNVAVRLDDGARLRLGGPPGLELGVTIL